MKSQPKNPENFNPCSLDILSALGRAFHLLLLHIPDYNLILVSDYIYNYFMIYLALCSTYETMQVCKT